ncbi:alpha/beta fold hydrolase [Bacillus sp. FJAT-22090]|uniref:alpha/beta fold hydrolase n=1 Tax=Bacillus sp. FJAT-22090 TaxID=1581038 RepID=UPI0011AA47BF|nr:alpha/beta hydrolase [Bacillus sp. FJAT-22090]
MILHTNVTGNGEPIVFLHTGLQTGLTDFIFQREYFGNTYQVISPDLRGHGQSKTNNIQNFFEDSAKDLSETLAHLNIKNVHLVGCSLGALVAIKFALMFPEIISTLSISGITPLKPENWLELHEQDVKGQAEVLNSKEIAGYFDQLHTSDWRQFIYSGKDENWYPFEDVAKISGFTFPTLFMVGEDKAHETIGATILSNRNKNIHIAIVPFAGHLVHTDQPQVYTNILETFINKGH